MLSFEMAQAGSLPFKTWFNGLKGFPEISELQKMLKKMLKKTLAASRPIFAKKEQ